MHLAEEILIWKVLIYHKVTNEFNSVVHSGA